MPDFCQACEEEHLQVNGNINEDIEMGANKTIVADPIISRAGDLTLVAGESVSFGPGFQVENRGVLAVIIETCKDYFNLKNESVNEKK